MRRGCYYLNVNRPKVVPKTDAERQAIARVEVLAEEYAAAEAKLLNAARHARDLRLPADLVAQAAGMSRATLYRRLAETEESVSE